MSGLLAVIITLLMIGLLIFIHELGHFLAAKSVGVVVQKFSIGFGPKLFARKIGDTEFSLRLFVLGGYVQMLGDQDPSSTTYDPKLVNDKRSYLAKGPWQKLWISSAGVIINFLFACVAFSAYLLFSTGYVLLPQIGDYNFLGATAREELVLLTDQFGLETEGGVVLQVDGKEIINYQDYVALLPEIEGKQIEVSLLQPQKNKLSSETLVLSGEGVLSNLDRDFLPERSVGQTAAVGRLSLLNIREAGSMHAAKVLESTQSSISAGEIISSDPEKFVGFYLLQIAGQDVYNNEELLSVLRANLGDKVILKLISAGGELVTIEAVLPNEESERGILGVETRLETPVVNGLVMLDYANPFTGGIFHSVNIVGYNAQALAYLIGQAFQGRPDLLANNVGSVVAIGGSVNQIISISNEFGPSFLLELLNIVGLFSAILAFMNILPIPVLDGGNILFIAIEALRGKPLPPKLMNGIYLVFVVVLIALSVGVVLLDVLKLVYN